MRSYLMLYVVAFATTFMWKATASDVLSDSDRIDEYLKKEVHFPYIVECGKYAGEEQYTQGPAGLTVLDLFLREFNGMFIKKGESWYLTVRPYYSEQATSDDIKLSDWHAKILAEAVDGGEEDSPDDYLPADYIVEEDAQTKLNTVDDVKQILLEEIEYERNSNKVLNNWKATLNPGWIRY